MLKILNSLTVSGSLSVLLRSSLINFNLENKRFSLRLVIIFDKNILKYNTVLDILLLVYLILNIIVCSRKTKFRNL